MFKKSRTPAGPVVMLLLRLDRAIAGRVGRHPHKQDGDNRPNRSEKDTAEVQAAAVPGVRAQRCECDDTNKASERPHTMPPPASGVV